MVSAAIEYGIDWFSTTAEKIIRHAKSNTSNYQNRVSCCMCLCGVLKAYLKHKSIGSLSDIEGVLTSYCTDKSHFVR